MAELFHLDIIAPDKTILSAEVSMAVIPGTEGDFGVLPRHAPLMSTLRPGLIQIEDASGETRKLFVSGGMASVENNRCIVLADRATPLSEIKRDEIVSRIEKIRNNILPDGLSMEQAKRELQVYEAMLSVAA